MFEIIAEFIASIFFEGGFEVSASKKVPRGLRIILFVVLSIFFLSISIFLIFAAFKAIVDFTFKIFLGIIGVTLFVMWMKYLQNFTKSIKKKN